MPKIAPLFRVPILLGEREEYREIAEKMLLRHGVIHTVNPLMLSYALTSKRFQKILRDGVNVPDGVGIKAAFALRGEKTDVFPGIDLCEWLFQKAKCVGFYGAKPSVAMHAYRFLSQKYHPITPAFFFDGYTPKIEEIKAELKAKKPDLVFVALGTPNQEKVLQELYDSYPNALYVGVGGSFDVFAGTKKRAPKLFRRLGLEWLFRMIKEPQRMKNLPRLFLFFVISLFSAPVIRLSPRKNEKNAYDTPKTEKNIVKN